MVFDGSATARLRIEPTNLNTLQQINKSHSDQICQPVVKLYNVPPNAEMLLSQLCSAFGSIIKSSFNPEGV